MNCTEFNQYLDDYLSDELDKRVQAVFLNHVNDCPGCRDTLETARDMTTVLRAMHVPSASAGFADRILQQAKNVSAGGKSLDNLDNNISSRVDQDAGRHRNRGFAMGFGSSLVAGMALWVVVALLPSLQDATQPNSAMADVTIALDQTSEVNLVFNAVVALENAKISIDLPEHIILAGYPELRQVEWRTNLVKGSNLLRLPIVATQDSGERTLVAHIEYGDHKITTLKIKLAVVKQKLTQRWLPDVTHA